MLSFSLVAEALTGLIYHRPSGENSKIPSFLPDLLKVEENILAYKTNNQQTREKTVVMIKRDKDDLAQ